MNCKNLIALMAAAAATAALYGCAVAPTPRHNADMRQEAAKDLGIARNVWSECIQAAIPRLDNPQSPTAVVARAAMKGCSAEYAGMARALARTLESACSRDPGCTHDALAKGRREAQQTATQDVVTARVRVAGAAVLKCE